MRRAAIVGVGWYGFRPATPEVSFREMVFEAASRAYEDAGIDPRTMVDGFVSAQEDYWEGIAIADEFAPEPIGGVLRPTYTVAGDGLQAVAQAAMMISSGVFDIVAVEAHAKPSDIETIEDIIALAYDPITSRHAAKIHPLYPLALDAQAYLAGSGADRGHLAVVAAANRRAGLQNPRASYAARVTPDDILEAPVALEPLTRMEIAQYVDAAVVVVLAAEDVAEKLTDKPVYIDGFGYATEVDTGALEYHVWGRMPSMRIAARIAYSMAGIESPLAETDFAEVEDRTPAHELIALEELGLAGEGMAWREVEQGNLSPRGAYPVNPSGGSMAMGVPLEATGLARLLEAVLQLRGEAGPHQLPDVERAIVASWRGPPTTTSMVFVLSSG